MNYIRIRGGTYLTNCYIIFGKDSATVIDPGFSHERIESVLNGMSVSSVILTHGHCDHAYESGYFRDKYGAKVFVHKEDVALLRETSLNMSGKIPGYEERVFEYDSTFSDGEYIVTGDDRMKVIHTPGHTPGSVSLLCDGVLFSGDTLFCGSIGRTDFPLSSITAMRESLFRIMSLDDGVKVEPGHGFSTTIGKEREENPFL